MAEREKCSNKEIKKINHHELVVAKIFLLFFV